MQVQYTSGGCFSGMALIWQMFYSAFTSHLISQTPSSFRCRAPLVPRPWGREAEGHRPGARQQLSALDPGFACPWFTPGCSVSSVLLMEASSLSCFVLLLDVVDAEWHRPPPLPPAGHRAVVSRGGGHRGGCWVPPHPEGYRGFKHEMVPLCSGQL